MHDAELIKALGGPTQAAKLFEVTPQAVSQWSRDGIPRARMMFLRLARPDLFADERRDTQAQQAAA